MEYKAGNPSLTVSIQDNDLGFSLTDLTTSSPNGIFKLTKYGLSPKGFCILRSVTRIEWLKRITAAVL